ncbi:MAG: TonB-dependent receptor [Candidatus Omnitrophica bacterium]|nr:TonB-dependent receptor [Candidatus Omnitrophota bacterium]
MFKIKLLAFFITLFVIFPQFSFPSEDEPVSLQPLVITKQKQFLLHAYTTDSVTDGAFNYESAVESLSRLPIDLQSRKLNSGIQTDFSLRGSTFQQVLILLNGQKINDPQTAHYNSDIPFTKADVKKIEVIPGAGSSLYGADAIGGAINFALASPKNKKIVWELGAGNNRNGYGLFSISDKFKKLGFRVSIEDAQSQGFRYDTEYKKFTAAINTSLDLPNGAWENNFGYQEKEFGAYDFYTPGLGYPSQEWTKTYLLNSGLTLDSPDLLIKPNFLWRRHFDKFILDRTQLRSTSVNNHHTDIFTPSVYLQKDMGLLGKAGLGLEWGQERIISSNMGKHIRDHKSIYLDDSLAIGQKWDLGFSLRLDDFSGFNLEYTGSISAKFQFTNAATFNFGVSRNMRVPSFTELYYSDSTTLGNAELAAEKTWNYQLGFEYKEAGFFSALTLFLRQEREMIDWVRPDTSQLWQARNFTRDNVLGVEYSLRKKINQVLSLDASYVYTNKSIDNQGYLYKYGPNYAQHLVNTVFSLQLPFGRQELGFNYKKRPGRRGWLLMNAGLNYNLTKNTRIFFNSTNLLNVEYQDIEGIPQAGRYIEAGLRLEW